MRQEKQRLLQMLESGKINEADYELLSNALESREGKGSQILDLLFNPFERVEGLRALLLGAAVLIALSLLGRWGGVHYPGFLDFFFIPSSTKTSFLEGVGVRLYQNVSSVLIAAILFFVAAKILGGKGIRFVDFFGMTAFARYTYVLPAIVFGIATFFAPGFATAPKDYPLADNLTFVVTLLALFWLGTVTFSAYRVASGLVGKRLWLSFIVALVLSEAISVPLTRLLTP